MGRRYSEVLAESLGQPGFCELMMVATDLDARRDVVAALLREPFRREFIAPRPGRERRSEVLDLAGIGREHALDLMAAALTPPVCCDPQLVTFSPDSYWRGETHRMCGSARRGLAAARGARGRRRVAGDRRERRGSRLDAASSQRRPRRVPPPSRRDARRRRSRVAARRAWRWRAFASTRFT